MLLHSESQISSYGHRPFRDNRTESMVDIEEIFSTIMVKTKPVTIFPPHIFNIIDMYQMCLSTNKQHHRISNIQQNEKKERIIWYSLVTSNNTYNWNYGINSIPFGSLVAIKYYGFINFPPITLKFIVQIV